ncbi:Imidazole glycerol phosphate synthase subunit HisH 1 [Maioricimonas rarisocia]|uniref:Imidazole glycerol phosphate synthase subunit HisH n=1 Tax=Maioricimonas rarisocia TaxID=2528026 RepID=A0A517Z269_9PLAN|nr:imidazole glycerol phosphate synthase subunit HisH [Maioricimonas rarisocia]QDU36567.1 Imidazole glycerol phosphate synthase subunit HisH 1 [Maioricimonas rarisocia]
MIQIIDYGMGNLRSVQKAFESLGVDAHICSSPDALQDAEKIVLPGVGAFRDAINELHRQGFVEPLREYAAQDRPFLGICLGLQLLFDVSYEDGEYEGLGIIPGKVVRFESQPGLKIPHMGWNQLEVAHPNPVLDDIAPGSHVYFVHSYHVVPEDENVVATRTSYGDQPFVSMIARGNLFATQFHPEKSQRVGLQMLSAFAAINGR